MESWLLIVFAFFFIIGVCAARVCVCRGLGGREMADQHDPKPRAQDSEPIRAPDTDKLI